MSVFRTARLRGRELAANLRVADLIQDGKSNYLEGAMLIGTYIIIALAFYVYPDDATSKGIDLTLPRF